MRVSYANQAVAEIDSLQGCSQVAVIHGAFVDPVFRCGGIGKGAHLSRLRMIKSELLYDAAICTVDDANIAQVKILETNGWIMCGQFLSRKTGHNVSLYFNPLKDI